MVGNLKKKKKKKYQENTFSIGFVSFEANRYTKK
jgi:hypothetical protein